MTRTSQGVRLAPPSLRRVSSSLACRNSSWQLASCSDNEMINSVCGPSSTTPTAVVILQGVVSDM